MSTFIKNPDGSQTEVFTQAEIDEQIKKAKEEATETATAAASKAAQEAADKALDEYKTANPDRGTEVDDLTTKLKEATDKLAEAEEGEGDEGNKNQVKRLKEAKEKAEENLATFMKETKEELENIKGTLVGNTKTKLMNTIDDAELKEKVELHYDSFKGDAVTDTEIEARFKSAVTLAGGNPEPGALDNITNSGSKGEGSKDTKAKTEVTDNAKKIGGVLGISEADREKYGAGGEKAANTGDGSPQQ